MTGRHKFSELEETIPRRRQARIERLAEKLGRDMDRAPGHTEPEQQAQTAHCKTYRYRVIHDGKVVHHGITIDPQRRQIELRARWPGATVQIVGPAVTRQTALEWRIASNRAQS